MATFQDLEAAVGVLATARVIAKQTSLDDKAAQTALAAATNNVKVIIDALTLPP